eukprot:NODE_386_length_8322_cov_0.935547.p6 type:complete len:157 gc:universal NODE_386_length_8322_cov_0.935547:7406-7876(+)
MSKKLHVVILHQFKDRVNQLNRNKNSQSKLPNRNKNSRSKLLNQNNLPSLSKNNLNRLNLNNHLSQNRNKLNKLNLNKSKLNKLNLNKSKLNKLNLNYQCNPDRFNLKNLHNLKHLLRLSSNQTKSQHQINRTKLPLKSTNLHKNKKLLSQTLLVP